MTDKIYRFDSGTVIECPVKENNSPLDLTNVSQIKIVINTRTRNFSKLATITDRVNGLCEISLTSDNLQDVGGYQIQGIVKFNDGNEFASDIQQFYVENRLNI